MRFPWPGQDCVLCGADAGDEVVCALCRIALPGPAHAARGITAAFAYRFPVDRLVRRFKFTRDLAVGRWLALQLAQRAAETPRPDLLVAPPLSALRLRERGFNQALEIAKTVGDELGLDVALDALVKERETPAQPGLSRRERRRNLRDAFACRRHFEGLHVVIVDDVVTTGATTSALARLLRGAGAEGVRVWAVARTPLD